MQQDTISLVARDFIDLVRNWNPPEQSRAAHIRTQFLDWDGNIGVNSKLALIYEVWKTKLSSKLTAKLLPVPRTNPRAVLAGLKANPHANELLSVSLDEALADIEKRLGPDESHWTWGKLHEAYFRHPLNVSPPADTSRGNIGWIG